MPQSDLEKATAAKEATWRSWQELERVFQEVVRDPARSAEAPSYARAVREARKAWEDATKHELQLAKTAGLYVPVSQVREIRMALKPLGDYFLALRGRLASRLEPEVRSRLYAAWEESMPEWNENIGKVDASIERLLPC